QLGDDGVVAVDQHAALPPLFSAPASQTLSEHVSATATKPTHPTATPTPIPAPLAVTPPTDTDPFVTLAQAALGKGLSVAYEGAGGTALLQTHPALTNAFVLDGATTYPTDLATQLRAAQLTPPGSLPALDAAHAPDTARTEALTQAFTKFVLPKVKVNTFLGIIRYDDPASTGALTGLGSPALQAALRANDAALGEILTALNDAGIQESVNVIVTSDHGLVDVIPPDAAS